MNSKNPQQTVLGPECRISGQMVIETDVLVMGRFDGTLRVGGILEIADGGQVTGTIIAGALRLGGRAEADVIAEHGAELLAGCHLSGRLYTNRLSVVDGAAFEGEVVVGPKAMAAAESLLRDADADKSDNGKGNGNGTSGGASGAAGRTTRSTSGGGGEESSMDRILRSRTRTAEKTAE